MSRHEVPKTAGNDDAFKIYDPAGCRTYRSVNQRDTLAGSCILKRVCFPGVCATSWLDTRAISANRQTFWVEILCGLILLSYFEVVVGII